MNGDLTEVPDASHEAMTVEQDFDFELKDLYSLAVQFYRDKEGKAMHLSYRDKLELVALTQQVTHGKFVPDGLPPVGYLDVIGKDRRQAWIALGDLSKEEAMRKFICLLNELCHLFKPFVEAHKRDFEEKKILEMEEVIRIEKEKEEMKLLEEAKYQEELSRMKQEKQKQQIQEALNKQTFYQFKAYAEKQYPGNPEQQAVLIRQLQEQHYQQYMQQLYQQQLAQVQGHVEMQPQFEDKPTVEIAPSPGAKADNDPSSDSESDDSIESPPIEPASMWTQKTIKQFKQEISSEGGNGVIKVGHGETVTVSVPTREDGTSLFWEFATDNYDIGFGVYFEWNSAPGQDISVLISENEDEEDGDEDEHEDDDPEGLRIHKPIRPPISVIIPVYRRDCHEEVYMGTHRYPAPGVYLLKFDNSYSLWRSKTLYYRVCYSR